MNAPKDSPFIDDVRIEHGTGKELKKITSHGAENVKILANYEAMSK